MVRRGKYSKRNTSLRHAKWGFRRMWRQFRAMSLRKKILMIAGPVIAALIIIPLLTYVYFARDIGDQERLMNRNNTGIVLLDRSGEEFYSFGRAKYRDILPLDQIADVTEQALIAAEDKDFYEHGGFSVVSILGALYANIVSGDATAYGGSTITQQLAKNTLLTENQTFLRKYQELAVSIAIEREYTKDQILEMYLNSVYFGEGAFGIKDAAETYFGKQPDELSLSESAVLIGLLPAPSAYSPVSGDPELAKERQATVLSRMVKNGFISEDEESSALSEELVYSGSTNSNDGVAPHFTEMVLSELYDQYGEETVNRSGYQVKTTLDLKIQRKAVESVQNQIGYIESRGGSNASVIAIDPTDGQVRALVGSADWDNEDFGKVNMATSKRQPGSSFKPVYYAEALALGEITPATIFRDEPTDFNGYRPLNADRLFRGDISVRNALAQSLNIPSVKVMQQLGVDTSVEAAKRMGITTISDTDDYGLSFALGSAEVPLSELSNVYAAFANEGLQFEQTIINSIDNKFGRTIFSADPISRQVISPEGAFLISSILSDNNARAPIFGNSLTIFGREAAVKTGTTDEQRDAWTIGYTPQLTVGVWVGNNDNRPMLSGGSDMAGPIWRGVMNAALTSQDSVPFVVPSGIEQIMVCYSNGLRALRTGEGVYMEYFLSSAQPIGICDQPVEEPKDDKKKDKDEDKNDDDINEDQEPVDEEVIEPVEPPVKEDPIESTDPPEDPITTPSDTAGPSGNSGAENR